MPEEETPQAVEDNRDAMDILLEKTMNPPQEDVATAVNEPEPSPEPEPVEEAPATEESAPEPEATEEEAPKDEATEETPVPDEFGYSKDDEEPAKDDDFDEAAYDAETEKQVESMEDPKERGAWKRLREQAKVGKTLTKDVDALQAKLTEAEEKAAQLDAMQARLEKAESISYEVQVRDSDEYKEQYEEPVKKVGSALDSLAEEYKISAEALVEVMGNPSPRARRDMIKKLIPATDEDGEPIEDAADDRADVARAITDAASRYKQALQLRDKMMDDAKGKFDEIAAKRAESETKAQEEAVKQRRTHLANLRSKLAAKSEDFADGGKYASAVDQSLKEVSAANVGEMSQKDVAYALFAGAAFPSVMAENAALKKMLGDRSADQAADKAATPNLSVGKPQEDVTSTTEGFDWDEALKKLQY